jgi:hypothetical protein
LAQQRVHLAAQAFARLPPVAARRAADPLGCRRQRHSRRRKRSALGAGIGPAALWSGGPANIVTGARCRRRNGDDVRGSTTLFFDLDIFSMPPS